MNETINKSNFQSQYLGKTKRRIKTLHVDSEMVSLYTSCVLKQNFHCFSVDWGNAMQCNNNIFTGTGNEYSCSSSQIYKHAINWVVVGHGLVPLKYILTVPTFDLSELFYYKNWSKYLLLYHKVSKTWQLFWPLIWFDFYKKTMFGTSLTN